MVMLPRSTSPQHQSYFAGRERMVQFCRVNKLHFPRVTVVPRVKWWFDPCAYYRPDEGIMICLELCGHACGHEMSRNWSWPGNTTDRTPYGVIAHELGHHVDWLTSEHPGRYWGDYGTGLAQQSGEYPISGYAPNPAEWFAEMFRLFVTNHALLYLLRPKTWELLTNQWKPVSKDDWCEELGPDVPVRVIKSLENKIRKERRRS